VPSQMPEDPKKPKMGGPKEGADEDSADERTAHKEAKEGTTYEAPRTSGQPTRVSKRGPHPGERPMKI